MFLKIQLPTRMFVYKTEVLRIVAESSTGSFGILPQRCDCITNLVPGILCYETTAHEEVFVAVDTGILVKTDAEVLVSVRRAIGGVPLERLHDLVKSEFLELDEQEQNLKHVLNKLESGFLAQFSNLSKG